VSAKDLAVAADAVREATREVIRAAAAGDAAAIERAIGRRGIAVSALEGLLREPSVASGESEALRSELALQAAEAEERLRRVADESGGRLRDLAGRSAGIGGYARHSTGSSSLDRSG
jgi:hypothetical protein